MLNPIEIINKLLNSPGGIFEIISLSIIILCVFAILMSIMINFAEAKGDKPRKEKKSIVETGTMFLFFIAFYLIIRFRIGDLNVTDLGIRAPLTIFGLIVIVVGTMVNVRGRISLGKNWANQIKIYEDHRLVTSGVYGIVRHPLYASLIWMFYAASIIYFNYLALLLNTFVFIPFMYYRAKQEEKMLGEQFKNYKAYASKVGMFFPR